MDELRLLLSESVQLRDEDQEKQALKAVCDLFRLEFIQVRHILDFKDKVKIEKKALLGDAILTWKIRAYMIEKYPSKDVGFITEQAKVYVSNMVMKLFLIQHLNGTYKQKLQQMNVHSAGTIFECLLEVSYETTTSAFEFLDYFIAWVENTIPKTVSQAFSESEKGEKVVSVIRGSLPKLLSDSLELEVQPVKKINPIIPLNRKKDAILISEVINKGFGFSHQGEKISVRWRSRQKIYYTNFFYSCCGTSVEEYGCDWRKFCPRSDWKNQNTYHYGKLESLQSGKQGGGVSNTSDYVSIFFLHF
eukprot:TRINITY_DN4657_c0_g2_i1.p1 TRINITY_DN4657_c0_g2~~TRINITY_DN4657_c0_g2_i1.p1  ORF type:complete len:304 (-),score=47.59 TRINITY_DN4657_c0_g2_i1:68-979(-)